MYSGHTALIRMIVGLLVVQVIVMAVTLGISMPKIMTTENCINTEIPVEMVAYRYDSCLYRFLISVAEGLSVSLLSYTKRSSSL